MAYDMYGESIRSIDFSADRLLEIVQEEQASFALEIEPKHLAEAKKLLFRSEGEVERFEHIEQHEVKDYHVWSIKKPELKDAVVQELYDHRDRLREASDELEEYIDRLKTLGEHLRSVRRAYVEFVEQLQTSLEEAKDLGIQESRSLGELQSGIIPDIERLIDRVSRAVERFEKELEERLARLDFLGRQIATLRDEPLYFPTRKVVGGIDDEPPEESDKDQDGPTQAEALVDYQDEQLEEHNIDDLDRGRRDERTRGKRGGRGRR